MKNQLTPASRSRALRALLVAALSTGCETIDEKDLSTGDSGVSVDSGSADGGTDDASGGDTAGGDDGSGDSGGSSDGGESGSDGGESGGDDDGGEAGGDDGGDDSGSDSGGDDGGGDDGDPEPEPVAQDTRSTGPMSYTSTSDTVRVSTQCDLDIVTYTPSGAAVGTVVLSHGFVRSGSRMEGWAEHFASWGFTTIVPDLCQSSFTNTDHEANAEDIVELVNQLGVGPVAYAGHSAGGLASALALSLDASAVGGVGLDPVDSGSMGADASFSTSFVALFGEPGSCNSRSNGVDMVNGPALLVSEAGHCDFESPKDAICDFACGQSNPTFSDAELQEVVRAFSTAALLGLYGDSTTYDAWWTAGGTYYDTYLGTGAIAPM